MIIGAHIYTNPAINRPNHAGTNQSGTHSANTAPEKENRRANTEFTRTDTSIIREAALDQFRKINTVEASEKRSATTKQTTIETGEYRQVERVKYDPKAFQAAQVFLEIQHAEEQGTLIDVYA